ncbi:MAG: MFS transporter [Anaerolineales bacterium]|nr:MFS transporter [Anaerolineales bacterium]
MFLSRQRQRLTNIYHEYPRAFWTVVVVNFIDRLGFSLLFPFFALYITRRFNVGMTEVGGLFAIWSAASFIGGFPGGALTDRLGRKGMIVFSLVATSLSSLALGFVNTIGLFFIVGFISGIFTEIGSPAYQAIVADILPEDKRARGYGIIRVAFNLAVVFGPVIGGFIAQRSYLALFIADALISLIAAGVVFFAIAETRPEVQPGCEPETTAESFGGYLRVLRDAPFMVFVTISTLAWLVYMNMNTTLGVYLRNVHHIPESGYGWILSLNAAMVVLFQFPITRRLEERPPMRMMAAGAALLAVGFAMYGFFSAYIMFLTAMAIITIGEMIMLPVSNALVAQFAPQEMRGRYSFMYGISWGISFAAGPVLAGLILDNLNPNWLWYACGLLGTVATFGFLALDRRVRTAVP